MAMKYLISMKITEMIRWYAKGTGRSLSAVDARARSLQKSDMLPTGKRGRGNAPEMTIENFAALLFGNLVSESRNAGDAVKELEELPFHGTVWRDNTSGEEVFKLAADGEYLLPSDLPTDLSERLTPINVLAKVMEHPSRVDARVYLKREGGVLQVEISMHSRDRGPLEIEPENNGATFWEWSGVNFIWMRRESKVTECHNWASWIELLIPSSVWRAANNTDEGDS